MSVLTFNGVTKEYASDAPALQSVSFSIESGEFTALAGPSGSGKSTALNLAAGLDHPSRGSVVLLGQNLSTLDRDGLTRLRRDSVGFVFQAYNLFPVLTAMENVEYPMALKKIPSKERRVRAHAALAEVGLDKYAKRFPSQLSGGQQQRVAIARAMVTDPQIVFADEPTANLDSKSAEKLLLLFSRLNETRETTFLFSSHDPRVLQIARRIITLTDGRISYDSAHKTPVEVPAELPARHAAPDAGAFGFESPWRGEA